MTKVNRVQILNGYFDPVTIEKTLDWITRCIHLDSRGYICTVNVAILMMMASQPRLQQFVNEAVLIVADGQPLIWVSQLFSRPLPERVAGIDLIYSLAKLAERRRFRLYLLGASQDVIQVAVANLQQQYPQLEICGFNDGYFSGAEALERVRSIRQSGAQILLVGMGVPQQEFFLAEHWSDLGVNLAIGVGGSFDVIAGKKRRAPLWVQDVGLEWLFRLLQEPRRLGKRYLTTNLQFIYYVLREITYRNFTAQLGGGSKVKENSKL